MITIINNKLFSRSDPPGGGGYKSVSNGSSDNGSIDYSEYFETLYYIGTYWYDYQRWGCDYINDDVRSAAYLWYLTESGERGVSAVGPISIEGGGDMPNSYTHENGTCFDFRLIGFNGGPGDVDDPDFDLDGNYLWIVQLDQVRSIVKVYTGDPQLVLC